jgi:hypothetical protein
MTPETHFSAFISIACIVMSLVASALGLHPYACLFIDATWKDMMRAYVDVVLARDTDQAHKRIQVHY